MNDFTMGSDPMVFYPMVFHGIKDSNKYGDFIIWKEMLRFAKEKSCSIIFVSRDLKKDWFQVLHGMTCGPCQELLEEFKLYSPKGDFHIYTLDQVISFANEGDKVLNKNDRCKK